MRFEDVVDPGLFPQEICGLVSTDMVVSINRETLI